MNKYLVKNPIHTRRDVEPLKAKAPSSMALNNQPRTTTNKASIVNKLLSKISEPSGAIHRKASTMDSTLSSAASRLVSPRAANNNSKNSFADKIRAPVSLFDNLVRPPNIDKIAKEISSAHRKAGSEMNITRKQKIMLNCINIISAQTF